METPQSDVRLESDHFVREISGQKQCLVLVYDEPSRTRHRDEVFKTELGMAVDDITINVFEPSGQTLHPVPGQPKFFTYEAVIAPIAIVGVVIGYVSF